MLCKVVKHLDCMMQLDPEQASSSQEIVQGVDDDVEPHGAG